MIYYAAILCMCAAASVPQYNHHVGKKAQEAAILSEARYLNADGKFGSAYKQEDGVEFKEESDAEGNRRGSYSYVDPTGHRRTVTYTAGKDGFRATGDGIPEVPEVPKTAKNTLPTKADYDYDYEESNQPHAQQPQPQYDLEMRFKSRQYDQYEYETTTQRRFYPSGKISLNRSPDGFSYTFDQVV